MVYNDLIDINLLGRFWDKAKQHMPSGGGDSWQTGSASGSLAHFTDGADGQPLESFIVDIQPQQAGSGDPSASNIRTLSGWTSIALTRCAKNLLPIPTKSVSSSTATLACDATTGTIHATGTRSTAGVTSIMTFDLPSASYKATCPGGSLSSPLLNGRIVRDNATMVNNIGQNDVSFTTSAFHKGLDFRIYVGASTWNNVLYPMVRASEDDNTFEPYKGNTYEIALGLTVYGGKLDVLSGELTVTHDYIASYSGQTLPGEWISDRAVYAAGTTPPIGAQVVYELATPTSYELTPPTITTLLGINNIWADCGEVAVKYPRDIMTRAEVQRMIDAAIYGAIGGSY